MGKPMRSHTVDIRSQPQVVFQDDKATETETETDTVNVHIQCEEAASTIQERFRRLQLQRIVSKASTGGETEGNPATFEDDVTEHSSKDGHSQYGGEHDSDIEHLRKGTESKSDDDESSSEEKKIDRTELYTNVFVACMSCALICFSCISSIIKFCAGKCGHGGVTDAVVPNLIQNGTSAPPGPHAGGGGNGAAPQPPP
jgi:hypothetical protein